jgi:hypothetical protein
MEVQWFRQFSAASAARMLNLAFDLTSSIAILISIRFWQFQEKNYKKFVDIKVGLEVLHSIKVVIGGIELTSQLWK